MKIAKKYQMKYICNPNNLHELDIVLANAYYALKSYYARKSRFHNSVFRISFMLTINTLR